MEHLSAVKVKQEEVVVLDADEKAGLPGAAGPAPEPWQAAAALTVPPFLEKTFDCGGPGDGRRGLVGRGAEQLRGVGPARLRGGAPRSPLQARQLLHLPPAAQHLRIPQGEPGQVGVRARRLPRRPAPPPRQHPPPPRRRGRVVQVGEERRRL
ncbi:hypothetical protein HU200_064885 [Digitaria exilis]|uniref:Uncharacterized protein n=1 Tax=Digitaria exilis TaxID=1010633 RepID=A0A834ZZ11_9POAL|nr:hypothetical protein HU200_064885 [Digitaria exilis]